MSEDVDPSDDSELQIVHDLDLHEDGKSFGLHDDGVTYRRLAKACLCAAADLITIRKLKTPGMVLDLYGCNDVLLVLSVGPDLISLQLGQNLDICDSPELLLLTTENSVDGWKRIAHLMKEALGGRET